ncbi:MAG: phosphatidylglycerophosphatase A, partial [Proteobacteria bacterium]|nr:phosphatidylglycerophosphatase A [Pseudomonadota bacterium]
MIRLPSFLSRLKWAGEHPKYSKVIELLAKPLIFGAITVGLGWQWRLPDGQIILIAASGIALFSINQIPRVLRSMRRGGVVFEQHSCNESANRPAADPLTHANQTIATDRPPEPKLVDSLIVWFAQGLGIGRVMSTAPGTWGSLLGLGWTGVLLDTGDAKFFLLGAVAATLASVWFCGQAERILQQKDPPSVVLDEIVAMPFCFFGMTILYAQRHPNQLLPPFSMLCSDGLLTLISVFALFRLFDIW